MLKMSFHADIRTETFASLINCIIDDALLETMPDIDQALLQFIIMNLVDHLLHICPYFVVNLAQDLCCWVAKGLMK